MKKIISKGAPAPIGHYSQAIVAGGFLWCSGQLGLEPQTGALVTGGFEPQLRQVFKNLSQVLDTAELRVDSVIKITLYLTDLSNFNCVNQIFEEFFGAHKPARTTVEVSALPAQALVELDCVAITK
jgi:2-iminobutanoate/2-iminopropanoate deaminase